MTKEEKAVIAAAKRWAKFWASEGGLTCRAKGCVPCELQRVVAKLKKRKLKRKR